MPGMPRFHQNGISLVIVLIFLFVLALLGVTTATVTGIGERQAGNSRDRDLAFQAAEAALTDAQLYLTQAGSPYCNDAKIQSWDTSTSNDNSPSYWAGRFSASCDNCFTPSPGVPTGAGLVVEQPRYLIDQRPSDSASPHARHYVVTARAVGGTTNAVVILQAEYNCDDSTCPACLP